jgi:hypothetical protein
MEQTLRAAAPNRWRDISAVLEEASGAISRSTAH